MTHQTKVLLAAVALTLMSAASSAIADNSIADRLMMCVEHSMPVAGQPCRLWLSREDSLEASGPKDVTVTFHVSHGLGDSGRIDLQTLTSSGDAHKSARWTPQRTGSVRITATVRSPHGSELKQVKVSPVQVHVTSRRLHFNYWQARPEQRFVTSVMDNSETTEAAIRWKRRGVMPLGYKSGQWHWAHGYDSPEKMTKLWNDLPAQRAGIVIDEFGGGDPVDQ